MVRWYPVCRGMGMEMTAVFAFVTRSFRKYAAIPLLVLFSFPSPSSAVSCHCFRDRTYDPSNPRKAEPYVLATTQNSFFAAVFGIPKKAVVQSKMSGTSGTDLWVAYYAAGILHLRAGDLMARRLKAPSWPAVLKGKGGEAGSFDARFTAALDSGTSDEGLASLAAGEVLTSSLGAEWKELEAMMTGGASTAEIVAASIFSRWSGGSPSSLFRDVRGGKTTWGGILHRLGIEPADVEDRILILLR